MNTVLNATRPTVMFDVKNAKHREEATRFIKTGTWSKSSVLFAVETPFRSVADMVRSRMLTYLIDHQPKQVKPAAKKSVKKTV